MTHSGSVVIWRSSLIPASETFIRAQADALTEWRPTFIGATRIDSALARQDDVIAYSGSARDRAAYLWHRLTGRSPRLRRLLRRVRPRLIHAHFGGDGWLVSHSAARLGIPLVITLHGHDVTRQPDTPGLRGWRYRRNLRVAFDRATVIIAVSEFIRQRAIGLGADPAKVRVHHTGVAMPPPPDRGDSSEQWDVAFVGRFVAKKGVDDLIEAVGMMPTPRPRLVLIGSGPLEPVMRARAAQLGLEATFLGELPHAETLRHMAHAKCVAAPSKTAADGDSEGLPTTILEAASLGRPVVSTYHSGIPDAVFHGLTGLLGVEGDRTALMANLRTLLGDDVKRARFGAQARSNAERHFDILAQTRQLEEIYDSTQTPLSGVDRVGGQRAARAAAEPERTAPAS